MSPAPTTLATIAGDRATIAEFTEQTEALTGDDLVWLTQLSAARIIRHIDRLEQLLGEARVARIALTKTIASAMAYGDHQRDKAAELEARTGLIDQAL